MAVCGDGKHFLIEEQLRKFGSQENMFVVAFLDCCRRKVVSKQIEEVKEDVTAPSASEDTLGPSKGRGYVDQTCKK